MLASRSHGQGATGVLGHSEFPGATHFCEYLKVQKVLVPKSGVDSNMPSEAVRFVTCQSPIESKYPGRGSATLQRLYMCIYIYIYI